MTSHPAPPLDAVPNPPKRPSPTLPGDHDTTPSLEDFRQWYADDDNNWWRISCGHHMNLFDEALDEIDRLRALLAQNDPSAHRDSTPSAPSPAGGDQ